MRYFVYIGLVIFGYAMISQSLARQKEIKESMLQKAQQKEQITYSVQKPQPIIEEKPKQVINQNVRVTSNTPPIQTQKKEEQKPTQQASSTIILTPTQAPIKQEVVQKKEVEELRPGSSTSVLNF